MHLQQQMQKPVMKYTRNTLTACVSTIELDKRAAFPEIDFGFLFDYKIFPGHIMSCFTQWQHEGRSMKAGDTIVQQVYIPPIKNLSQKIIFGVRVSEVINEPFRRGFSYETLEGHVEKGISTFTVEQHRDGLLFKIHTYSGPGNLLSQLLGPVFSVPYQAYCTRKALEHVRNRLNNQVEEKNR